MKNYKLIGLTGTTGAGKGEVRAVFSDNGYGVVDADILARAIMTDPVVLRIIQNFFGDDVVTNGSLNRKLLAARAFDTKESTDLLSKITHPFITPLLLKQIEEYSGSGVDKIVFDAPQLFESGLNLICDATVAVTAQDSIRLERIKARDGLDDNEAKQRIKVQFSDDFFRENCDYVIENNSDIPTLKSETQRIIDMIQR